MADMEPQVATAAGDGGTALVVSGDWTARHARQVEALATQAFAAAGALTIDCTGIRHLDTFGAWSLQRLRQKIESSGATARLEGIAPRNAGLIAKLGRLDLGSAEPLPSRFDPLMPAEEIGRSVSGSAFDLLALASMFGRIVASAWSALVAPATFRWKSVIHHIDQAGLRAVPIVSMMTFLIGCIIAQQGFFHFRKFGATDYVVSLVTILVMREIGVLLVTIMVAGRSGSAYAAELGSMKMREEVDALRTMGLDPVDILILPRAIALFVSLPMLTFIGIGTAMIGAAVVAVTYGDMSLTTFAAEFRQAFSHIDLEVGLIKAPIMALVIGTVASLEGLRVQGSAASLGVHTTQSVVKTIFFVIVLDGVFAVLFAAVGM